MGWTTYAFLLIGGWFASSLYGMYAQLRPVACEHPSSFTAAPGASTQSHCMRPLFPPTERVDVRVYATQKTKPSRWRSAGAFAQMAPLWSATNISLNDKIEANAALPLALATHARRNGSLALHVIVVRAGKPADPSAHVRVPDPRNFRNKYEAREIKAQLPRARWRHMLHTSASLTRYLPAQRSAYKGLLDAGSSSAEEVAAAAESTVAFELPGIKRTVRVDPSAVLQWGGLAFVLSAWSTPTVLLAAVRGAFVYGVAPYAWMERARLAEEAARAVEAARRAAEAGAAALLRATGEAPDVVHLRPTIRIRVVEESGHFSLRAPPPMLYSTIGDLGIGGAPVAQQKEGTGRATSRLATSRPATSRPAPGGMPRRMALVEMDHANPDAERWSDARYVAPLFVDDASLLRREWRELSPNISLAPPSVSIVLEPIGRLHYSVLQQMQEASSLYTQMGLGEREIDELKWMFFSRPMHVIIAMQLISVIQMALTSLAFKNEIAFFKGRSDYTGLSSRSLVTDAIQAWVFFFYLLDYEHTSRIILFQVGMGALVASWKVRVRMRLTLCWHFALPWIVAPSAAAELDATSASERETEAIDQTAMRYLKVSSSMLSYAYLPILTHLVCHHMLTYQSDMLTFVAIDQTAMRYLKWVLYPLSFGWGLYCLVNYEYKSWWSWLISSLADFAYTFGFVNMMPQVSGLFYYPYILVRILLTI